jgi:hypothetical protein
LATTGGIRAPQPLPTEGFGGFGGVTVDPTCACGAKARVGCAVL